MLRWVSRAIEVARLSRDRGGVNATDRVLVRPMAFAPPSPPRTTRCCSQSSSCSARLVASSTYAETFKLAVKQADLNEDGHAVRASGTAPPRSRDRLNDVRQATVPFEQLFEDEPRDASRSELVPFLNASGTHRRASA